MIIFNIVICLIAIGVFLTFGMFISNKLLGVYNDIMDYMREINRGVFIHEINPKICKSVDFPAPLVPTMAIISPSFISADTP